MTLSHGMRRRLDLGLALACEPRMLLMDRFVYDAAGWPRVGEPSSTPQLAPTVNGGRGGGRNKH
jgi:ABC-type uncharacterized transport system ATPase subunit